MTNSIDIDYIPVLEKVYFSNSLSSDTVLWQELYSEICDFVPASVLEFDAHKLTFPWRYFLSITDQLRSFFSANRGCFTLNYSQEVIQMLKVAQLSSYNAATKLSHRTREEIVSNLKSLGFKRDLTAEQIQNLVKISNLPSAATFSVPGSGKTTEALAFFYLNSNSNDKLLVVAPKNAFGAWDDELFNCIGVVDDPFVRLRGKDNISNLLSKNPRFSIITYDQLARVKETVALFLVQNKVFMFLDESHRIKGGKQAKRAEAILDLSYLPIRKLVMSGTPMPQSEKDLLSQFLFLYPAKDADQENVVSLFQSVYARTTKEQLGIPEVHRTETLLKMPMVQRQIYKTLKSEIRRQLNPRLTDSSRFELRKIGKCVMKVMEFVSNPSLLASDMDFIFDRRVGALLLKTDGPKIDYVCRKARELASKGMKTIIWSSFVQNVELIAFRLNDIGADFIHGGVDAGDEKDFETREGKIKKFHDDPKCMVLVANPAACSEGISLHKVCSHAIYLDRTFNAAHYLQSEDRIHRLGIERSPEVEIVECEDSIDQVIAARLKMKIDKMAAALNDSSLHIEPEATYYADDEDDASDDQDENELTNEDAQAVLDYFFYGGSDD